MKSCSEMRREAFALLRGGWFWRILCVAIALQCAGNLVVGTLACVNREMGIPRLSDYVGQKMSALQQGLDYTLPTAADYGRMLGAGFLENFLLYVFGAIMLYGCARVLLKASRRDTEGWFAESLDGFRRPLGVAGLLFLQNLVVMLWSLLFIIPGIIAAYRFRQAWYVKNEHPDWTARACMAESARLMRGYKWEAFVFDLSYFGWSLLIVALVVTTIAFAQLWGVDSPLTALSLFCMLGVLLFAAVYYSAGRTVFYREVKALNPSSPAAE